MQLRRTSGEVGEQPRALERDLLMLEESAERTLTRVAERALAWSRSSGRTMIAPTQISEWTHAYIEEQLQAPIRQLRGTAERAIHSLQQIADALQASDVPSPNEVELFFRDLPRFDLVTLTETLSVSPWVWFGDRIAMSRIRSRLKESMEHLLKAELHSYARALYQWGEQTTRRLERLLNSYADSYRMQIQRLSGTAEEPRDIEQLRQDLASLLKSGETAGSCTAQRKAS